MGGQIIFFGRWMRLGRTFIDRDKTSIYKLQTSIMEFTKMNEITLVDENDKEIGAGEKMDVHRRGLLHRAFSVFVFNDAGEMLIQRRALEKYHCGGLWTNTCCSHPAPGETWIKAAHRRLPEEMGLDCPLTEEFVFTYRAEFKNNLVEHEIDHVFFGTWDGVPKPNPDEVCDYRWITEDDLREEMKKCPEKFAPWFLIICEELRKHKNCNSGL